MDCDNDVDGVDVCDSFGFVEDVAVGVAVLRCDD